MNNLEYLIGTFWVHILNGKKRSYLWLQFSVLQGKLGPISCTGEVEEKS